MTKHSKTIIIALAAFVLILLTAVIYFVNQSKSKEEEMAEVIEMMTYEKEKVAQEYQDLTFEFDGYKSNLRNDSLLKLLDSEKLKVQNLLEELRQTKATDARKIKQLKDELASIRKVMQHLVMQIDSLSAENKVLKTENTEVKRRYEQVNAKAQELAKQKENLSEVVTRASKLEISRFEFNKLNNKNKKTSWFSKIANLEFRFAIAKNITAEPGTRIVYLRIQRPDGEVLTKSSSDKFSFENRKISYSAKKEINYGGQELNDVLYWKVEEIIQDGMYRADFFTDGNMIGSYDFSIK